MSAAFSLSIFSAADRLLWGRTLQLKPTEILVKVFLPYNKPLEYVREFKQAHRRDDDIAIANAGMRVSFKKTSEGLNAFFDPVLKVCLGV